MNFSLHAIRNNGHKGYWTFQSLQKFTKQQVWRVPN